MRGLRFLALSLAAALLCGFSWAGQPKVQVLAVEVFNSPQVKEIAPGLRSMIASRISGEGYEVSTRDDMPEPADFTLRTTITRLGGLYSVDAELAPLKSGVEGVRGYEAVPEFDDIMKALEKVCERVKSRLGQLAGMQKIGEQPLTPPLERHPPRLEPALAASPAPTPRTPADALQVFREVAKIEGEAVSLTSGDFDRDGALELAIAVGRTFQIYRETLQGVQKVWEGPSQVGFSPLLLSSGDLDGDGVVELALAGFSGADAYTQVYRWSEKGLSKVGDSALALLRITASREGRTELVGMTSVGGTEALSGLVRRFDFNGGKIVPGDKLPLPDLVTSLDFQWVSFDKRPPVLLLLDREHKLRIYNEKFGLEASTETPVMGSRSRLEGERDQRSGEIITSWEVNAPGLLWSAPDGHDYLLTHANAQAAYTPGVWKSYESGALAAIRWDGVALHKGGESPKFPGYIAGLARGAVDRSGRGRVYALLLKIEGLVFRNYSARLIAFDL